MINRSIVVGAIFLLFSITAQSAEADTLQARATVWIGKSTFQLDVVDVIVKTHPISNKTYKAGPAHPEKMPGFIPVREVRIRCIEDCKGNVSFREEVGMDSIMGTLQFRDDSPDFITTWVTGSAYRVRIYRIDGNRIHKVMEEGSKSFPQFIYDKDGAPLIVMNNPDNPTKPSARSIKGEFWKWNGGKYAPVSHKRL